MTSSGNATSWPPFRYLPLWTEPEKLTFVVFREHEQQSMNHFSIHAASKLKFLIFYVHTASRKINRNEWVIQKTGSSSFSSRLRRRSRPSCVKAHANGRNSVGQHQQTLLGPTMLLLIASVCMEPQQCWHLLTLVAYSLKPVKLLGPCKRTQHCWPTTPNNVGSCWHLLRPFAWALKSNCVFEMSWIILT